MAADAERPGAGERVPPGGDVGELRRAAEECRGCELWRDATQVVFSRGRSGAPLMLVGEQAHIVACRPWLEAEFDAVGPSVVVALGATAARSVLGRSMRIGDVRGKVLPPDVAAGSAALPAPTLVTTHPSALLRIEASADRAAAFQALVDDLRTAADAAS
jgi:uracil-DNA glycosylase